MKLVWLGNPIPSILLISSKRRRSGNEIEHPCGQNIIAVGQFIIIHKLSDKVVRKVPLDESYVYSMQAIEIEGRVYNHLGKHPRIAHCLKTGSDFVDLRYESNGDLETYLKQNPLTSDTKYRLAQQAVEAVVYVYGKDVIHSDLSARQFLVGQDLNIQTVRFWRLVIARLRRSCFGERYTLPTTR